MTTTVKKFSIPEKPYDFLVKHDKKIKPLVKIDPCDMRHQKWDNFLGHLFWHLRVDLHKTPQLFHIVHDAGLENSFPWSPRLTAAALGLVEITKIRTLHTYGYYGFFKPSVKEVLSQIPDEYLDETEYFWVQGPEDAADVWKYTEEVNEGFHVAETTLYKR